MRATMRRWGRWITSLFWALQFAELTLSSYFEDHTSSLTALWARLIVFAVGLGLTWALIEVCVRAIEAPFRRRLTLMGGATFATYVVLTAFNFTVFFVIYQRNHVPFAVGSYFWTGFAWSWFFLSIGSTLLALSVSLDVRDRERRVADFQRIASEAQMMALRHQLNPHFLFNTLNSIAALIEARENSAAEEMVENLSDFLRATLELDPLIDVTLEREIELQKLYLEIECVRFPDRLRIKYDIPDGVKGLLVPPLITQPLVENAIHHGVARNSTPVLVAISARVQGGLLHIAIANDVSPLAPPIRRSGVGLANVRARLERRFGEAQRVLITSTPANFRVVLSLPIEAQA